MIFFLVMFDVCVFSNVLFLESENPKIPNILFDLLYFAMERWTSGNQPS